MKNISWGGNGIMVDGDVRNFIEKLYYEDHYVIYNGEKYFFNGCQTKTSPDGNVEYVSLEVYNLTTDKTIFSTKKSFASDCILDFEEAPIWNGKTFWEVENEMQWVDE